MANDVSLIKYLKEIEKLILRAIRAGQRIPDPYFLFAMSKTDNIIGHTILIEYF